MKKVAGVSFRENGRIYYFDPNNIELKLEDKVIAETNGKRTSDLLR